MRTPRYHRWRLICVSALTACAVAAVAWVIAMSLLSLFANGSIYHVEQPVPVLSVNQEEILLLYHRWARLDMAGTCSRELQCEQVYEFGARACPLEKGASTFGLAIPVPETANGTCVARGVVEYSPLGTLGPRLTHMWESEPFEVGGQPTRKE